MATVQLDFIGHKEHSLQKAFARTFLYFSPRYTFVAPNIKLKGYGWESDLVAIRKSGFLDEIEIKRTLADFRADFKKADYHGARKKHSMLANGELLPNYFYFYTTDELYEQIKDEIPDHAGAIVFMSQWNGWNRCQEAKKAPRLHDDRRMQEKKLIQLGNKMMHRYWNVVT